MENDKTRALRAQIATLVQEYAGRLPLFHVDLYRLAPGEVDDLGLDALAAQGVLAIEWAERLPRADAGAIHVRLEHAGEDVRRVTVTEPA